MAKAIKKTGDKPKLHIPEEPSQEREWDCYLDDGNRNFREATRRVVSAVTRDEAVEKFKQMVGIRSTPHVVAAEPIEAVEEQTSEQQTELDSEPDNSAE